MNRDLLAKFVSKEPLSEAQLPALFAQIGLTGSEWDYLALYEQIRAYCETFVSRFDALSIPELGFHGFRCEELYRFLFDDRQFGLNFNKKTGAGVLYGPAHTQARRDFVNQLPDPIRLACLRRKLLLTEVLDVCPDGVHIDLDQMDIVDIGMGHGIYALIGQDQSWVLKSGQSEHQAFFMALLDVLGWPSCLYYDLVTPKGQLWQLSAYSPPPHLHTERLKGPQMCRQLAYHAALGDLFGRGDRHFDNYVCRDQDLFPVDVSILFWPNNNEWVSRYTSGGLSELAILMTAYLGDMNALSTCWEMFFDHYESVFELLREKQSEIKALLGKYYRDPEQKMDFILSQINHQKETLMLQKEMYRRSLISYKERVFMKPFLWSLLDRDPSLGTPLRWMYYFANQTEWTAFFLLDYHHRRFVLDEIKALALAKGVLTDGDWDRLQYDMDVMSTQLS